MYTYVSKYNKLYVLDVVMISESDERKLRLRDVLQALAHPDIADCIYQVNFYETLYSFQTERYLREKWFHCNNQDCHNISYIPYTCKNCFKSYCLLCNSRYGRDKGGVYICKKCLLLITDDQPIFELRSKL